MKKQLDGKKLNSATMPHFQLEFFFCIFTNQKNKVKWIVWHWTNPRIGLQNQYLSHDNVHIIIISQVTDQRLITLVEVDMEHIAPTAVTYKSRHR